MQALNVVSQFDNLSEPRECLLHVIFEIVLYIYILIDTMKYRGFEFRPLKVKVTEYIEER